MNSLYNEYLTGAEREAAIIVAESDAQLAKLNVLFEAVDATLEANMLVAEAKVLTENGTYDDLTMLYKEAGEEAATKKKGILATIVEAIAKFFGKIGDFIKSKFGKNVEQKVNELPEDEVKLDKSFLDKINVFKKGWDLLKGSVEKIKAGNFESLADVAKAWAPIATAFSAVAAGTTVIAVKRQQIVEWIVWLRDTVLAKVNTAINAIKVVLGVGAVQSSLAHMDGKKTIPEKAMDVLKTILNTLQKFGGWIGNWLGKIYSALPFVKKNDKNEKPDNDNTPTETNETKTESVSLFGIELNSEDFLYESEMTDEEYNELCELFAEL